MEPPKAPGGAGHDGLDPAKVVGEHSGEQGGEEVAGVLGVQLAVQGDQG